MAQSGSRQMPRANVLSEEKVKKSEEMGGDLGHLAEVAEGAFLSLWHRNIHALCIQKGRYSL